MAISIAVLRDPLAWTNPLTITADGILVATWDIGKMLDCQAYGGSELIALHLTNALADKAPHALLREEEVAGALGLLLRMLHRCLHEDQYDGE